MISISIASKLQLATAKCGNFELKMHQNAFGGRAPPVPGGKLEHSPSPIALRQTALSPTKHPQCNCILLLHE